MIVERHLAQFLGDDVSCTGCGFKLNTLQWGPNLARSISLAHGANPRASTEDLLKFVSVGTGHGAAGEPQTGAPIPPLAPFETSGSRAAATEDDFRWL